MSSPLPGQVVRTAVVMGRSGAQLVVSNCTMRSSEWLFVDREVRIGAIELRDRAMRTTAFSESHVSSSLIGVVA